MKKTSKASTTKFSRFVIDAMEKNHPAMLVLDPDDYNALSEADRKEANNLARAMSESVFAKDKANCLSQLRERFGGACVKKILMDMRPTDGWVGKVTMGVFPSFKGKALYRDKLEKHGACNRSGQAHSTAWL